VVSGARWETGRKPLSVGSSISAASRILVAGPAWVGDMVMAQSLFITLKQQNPDYLIDVVAPGWSVPLLQRMPQVNKAIELAVGHGQFGLLSRFRLGRRLRERQYDRAIVLPRSFKSALVPFFAGARRRTGYCGEQRYGLINDMRRLDKQLLTQTVQRYVALGLMQAPSRPPAVPYPQLLIDQQNQQALLQRLGLNTDKAVIGFMPGAEYGTAKQWPATSYRELAQTLVEHGKQVWIFGSAKESSLGEEIRQQNPAVTNLCGKTSLVDAVDLIAMTENNVTNDSGLMHVAAASGRPLIAIYGSSSPEYTPPLSVQAKIIYLNLDCSPCFDRRCRYGHTNCLNKINPDIVWHELKEMLE